MPGLTREQLEQRGATLKTPSAGVQLGELREQGATRSFRERVGERVAGRREALAKGFEARPGVAEATFQTVGQAAGLAFDVGAEALVSGFRALPEAVERPIRAGATDILETPLGQAGLSALAQGIEKYQEWKEINPRTARNIEAAVNIGFLVPGGAIGKPAIKGAVQVTGKVAGIAAGRVEARLGKQVLKETLGVIKPVLTKAEKRAGLEAGRGITRAKVLPKKFELTTLKPLPSEVRIAKTIKDIVKPSKRAVDNIDSLRVEIGTLARRVEVGLEGNNTIFSKRQLTSFLDDTKQNSRILFGSDKTLEKGYDTVIEEIVRQAEKYGQNLSGLLEARKAFDRVIEQKFGAKFLSDPAGDVIKKNAVMDVRRATNEFIANKLPKGNEFKGLLKKQNQMYDAIAAISNKMAGTVDISVTRRAMSLLRQNPLVAGVTGGILTFGALAGMFSNPIVLGGLLMGGTIKIGTTIITSRTLKLILIKSLRILEKAGGAANLETAGVVRILIRQMDEAEVSVERAMKNVIKRGGKKTP